MSKRGAQPRALGGRATAEGTRRLAARHRERHQQGFFRSFGAESVQISSVGIGTYLGSCDERDDERYFQSVRRALEAGINLIDSAINYRCQRSERSIGQALSAAARDGIAARDEVVVCTKGGYIPLDGTPPGDREAYQAYLQHTYFDQEVMHPDEVVAGAHSLAPSFIADQIRRSRENLRVQTVDVYYLHNPEQQLDVLGPTELYDRVRHAFVLLEEKCAAGEIGCYGVATWNGLRVPPETRGHLSLFELHAAAREAGGDGHHFRAVQLPVNLAFTEAVREPTQQLVTGQRVPVLHAAAELGLDVIASATLLQSRLANGLPPQLHDALPGCRTDAQRAIAFVLSLPVISAALIGMRTPAHVDENVAVPIAV